MRAQNGGLGLTSAPCSGGLWEPTRRKPRLPDTEHLQYEPTSIAP
ncbi:hypothetical protein N9V68_01355 [Octadecabacter sp.]|nr:hypothetical protein [Octadecabacter sp.]